MRWIILAPSERGLSALADWGSALAFEATPPTTAYAVLLPLYIQVHHAVCDGYHLGAFVEKLQEYVNGFRKDEGAETSCK